MQLLIFIAICGFLFVMYAILSVLSDIRTNLDIINETLKEMNRTIIRF